MLRELPLKPSDDVRRQLRFTPFPGEPVAWMIEQGGDELFCFSSDYPHIEGTRARSRASRAPLDGVDEEARRRFYATNFADLMGGRLPQAV